jgi:hypothetical protein
MKHRSGSSSFALSATATVAGCLGLAGAAGFATPCPAETIAVDTGIAVKDPGFATPSRGMTMQEVIAKFGAPTSKLPAIGKPPIARWEYAAFVVYFEFDHVVHTVVSASQQPAGAPPADAQAPDSPPT